MCPSKNIATLYGALVGLQFELILSAKIGGPWSKYLDPRHSPTALPIYVLLMNMLLRKCPAIPASQASR
eukprot:1158837-Pelagomonas_calceolata.AAC.4